MSKGKKERIRLESQIQKTVHQDNGVTTHFDYKINMNSKKNTIELNVLTFNPMHDDYMLLRKKKGSSAIVCLEDVLHYLQSKITEKAEYSYTVTWNKISDSREKHLSYFRGRSEEEVLRKFLHEKDAESYEFSIKQNPIT